MKKREREKERRSDRDRNRERQRLKESESERERIREEERDGVLKGRNEGKKRRCVIDGGSPAGVEDQCGGAAVCNRADNCSPGPLAQLGSGLAVCVCVSVCVCECVNGLGCVCESNLVSNVLVNGLCMSV